MPRSYITAYLSSIGQNYVKLARLTAWAYCSRMDVALAEPQQIAAVPDASAPQPSASAHHHTGKRWGIPFTKENSAEMARKAQAAAKQRKAEEELASAKTAQVLSADDASYRLFRLQRTREQLLALDKQLEACSDPKLVKSLADAIARLCDVEQKLAMRPLPGSRRPGRESTSKAPSSFEPSE